MWARKNEICKKCSCYLRACRRCESPTANRGGLCVRCLNGPLGVARVRVSKIKVKE